MTKKINKVYDYASTLLMKLNVKEFKKYLQKLASYMKFQNIFYLEVYFLFLLIQHYNNYNLTIFRSKNLQ